MTDYVYTSNFGAKDALPRGNPEKSIRGVEFETEFNAIEQSLQTKLPRPGTGAGFIPTIETSVEGNELVPTTLVPEAVVTLTDTQTLTNKTIIDPAISGGTTTSQTLESPTLNNAILNNPTLELVDTELGGTTTYTDNAARIAHLNSLGGIMGGVAAMRKFSGEIGMPSIPTTMPANLTVIGGVSYYGQTGPFAAPTGARWARISWGGTAISSFDQNFSVYISPDLNGVILENIRFASASFDVTFTGETIVGVVPGDTVGVSWRKTGGNAVAYDPYHSVTFY